MSVHGKVWRLAQRGALRVRGELTQLAIHRNWESCGPGNFCIHLMVRSLAVFLCSPQQAFEVPGLGFPPKHATGARGFTQHFDRSIGLADLLDKLPRSWPAVATKS